MGASTPRILFRHILPGVLPLFIVGLTASMAAIAGAEVALSYIGLGIDPPDRQLRHAHRGAQGPRTFEAYPHLLLFSAGPVILFFFAWNLLRRRLVDLLEPRSDAPLRLQSRTESLTVRTAPVTRANRVCYTRLSEDVTAL